MNIHVTDGNGVVVEVEADDFNDPMVPVLAFKKAVREKGRWILFAGIKPCLDQTGVRWSMHTEQGRLLHFWLLI